MIETTSSAKFTELRGARCSVPQAGKVRLRHAETFGEPNGAACRQFLGQILSLDFVRQVDILPAQGAAEIKYIPTTPASLVLERMAAVLRRHCLEVNSVARALYLSRSKRVAVRIYRYPGVISTWEVRHELPGRMRVRHEELWRRPTVARFIESELSASFGVQLVAANPATGSVLIEYDRRQLTRAKVLHLLEHALVDLCNSRSQGYVHMDGTQALSTGSLALAATADFAISALTPLSAGLLIATNLKTLRDAGSELLRLRPGVATLHSAIVAATLASGMFFSAALMTWLMEFWDRKYHHRFANAQRQLLARARRQPRFVWLCRADSEFEIPLERVRPGDVLAVRAGEAVPADGIVVEGIAKVEDCRAIDTTPFKKKRGDKIWAGGRVISGELRLKVVATNEATQASSLQAIIERVTTPAQKRLKVRGEPFARATVAPTLATAAIGLFTGDIQTAAAILRADYASGPGMTMPLGLLQDISDALKAGVVVANTQFFAKLREVTTVLIDGENIDIASAVLPVTALREENSLSVGIINETGMKRTTRCSKQWDAGFNRVSAEQLADVIRQYQKQGQRIAFIGDCNQHSAAAHHAHVAISTSLLHRDSQRDADAFLLGHSLTRIVDLWRIANRQRVRSWSQIACTVIPNLFCIAGAFTLGFTGLHTVLLTNLGTLTVYRGAERWLRDRNLPPTTTACVVQRLNSPRPVPRRVAWNGES